MGSQEPCNPMTAPPAGANPGGTDCMLSLAWQTVTSNVEAAGMLIQQAKALSLAEGYEKGVDECLLLEARYDGEMDRYFDALRKANDAYQKYIMKDNAEGRIRACRVIGYLYSRHGRFDMALEHLFLSLKLIRESGCAVLEGLYPIEVFLLNNIAFIYAETGRDSDALKFFYQAFELAKKHGGSMIATILTNIAEMHLNTGDARMALRYNRMALTEIKRQKLGYHDMHNCYNSFGLIYRKMGQYDKALESFRQSLDSAEKGESKYNQIVSRLALARLYLQIGDCAAASAVIDLALQLADEIKANVLLRDLCLVMAQASERTGNLDGALGYYKRHMELSDEISTREVEQRLSDYTAEFKAEQAIKDAEIYRLKNIELKQKSDELEQLNRNLTVISEIGRKITSSLDIGNVLNTIYDSVNSLMDAGIFGIGLYNEANGSVDLRMIIDNSVRKPLIRIDAAQDDGYIGSCVRRRREIVIGDTLAEGLTPMDGYGIAEGEPPRSLICFPLLLAGSVIGIMTVQSRNPNAYSHSNLETIRALGSYIAVALNNSRISEELRQKANALELISKTDPLTGIYNRRYIIEKMEEERTRFRRYGKKFSLIVLDIDFFKRVNDGHGHDCGDYVLVETARQLKQMLREQDCLARWGGEEFLTLLPETDAQGAAVLAERLRVSIQDRVFEYRRKRVSITLTLGVCEYGEGITIDDAIRKADNALYEGKQRGRNCVVVGE